MEKEIFPFSHRWTIANLDWFCENVNGHQKLETKVQYNNVLNSNEPSKWITLELFPKGFDQENANFISLCIRADEYIFFRLWIENNNSHENVLKVENSNKLSKEIKIKDYIRIQEILEHSNQQTDKSYSINIEGVVVKTKSFNVLKNLNQVNELIGKVNITYDSFDFMGSIQSICIYKWKIEKILEKIKKNTKKFDEVLQFANNISFRVVMEEKDNLMWKIYFQLITTESPKLFMWFRMKKIDDDENENNSIIKNVQQVKVFQNINEIMEFKNINMKKLQANKRKYFPDEKLEFSFELIRFKNSFYKFNQVQESKLEEFVMKRFTIFNYISFDSLQLFFETSNPKKVTREELVNNLLTDQEKQEQVFNKVEDVITNKVLTNMSKTKVQNGSIITYILNGVFINADSDATYRDIEINSGGVSQEKHDQLGNMLVERIKKLENKINFLQNSVDKYNIKSEDFNVDQNGVQVKIKIEDIQTLLSFFINFVLPFINEETTPENFVDDKWLGEGAKNKVFMTLIENLAQEKTNRKKTNNSDMTNAKLRNELKEKISESISTVSIPIGNYDLVMYWAMMFAYGDLNQMRNKIPLRHFKSISIHAENIINNYQNQNEIMKNSHNNLTVHVANLIIKQINELTDEVIKETDQLERFITIDYLNKQFK